MLFRTLFCSKTPYVKIPPSSVTPTCVIDMRFKYLFLADFYEFFEKCPVQSFIPSNFSSLSCLHINPIVVSKNQNQKFLRT